MSRIAALLALALALGCGDDSATPDAAPPDRDKDDDGYDDMAWGGDDCNDNNAAVHPGAPDPCDGIDWNCSGRTDDEYDQDDDTFATCQGDCADNNPLVYPGATETIDGLDNDCDGLVDNHNSGYDDDGDGYSEDQGDCDDAQVAVNPAAMEVQFLSDGVTPETVDNDCDGEIDEVTPPCEGPVDPENPDDPLVYAHAIGLCDNISAASWIAPSVAQAHAVVEDFGTVYVPRQGYQMIVLSSGIAADINTPGYVEPQIGTDFGDENVAPHPNPGAPAGCGTGLDPAEVKDYVELALELRVPTNARSFSFDFNFMSVEYPEYVCSNYDDTFVAMLDSDSFVGNISFDSVGAPVSVNVAFFTVCPISSGTSCTGSGDLAGTGHQEDGGGTGWLRTTAPVTPGEKMSLRFIIFDEFDHILDSTVLIDNFVWGLEPIETPHTEP